MGRKVVFSRDSGANGIGIRDYKVDTDVSRTTLWKFLYMSISFLQLAVSFFLGGGGGGGAGGGGEGGGLLVLPSSLLFSTSTNAAVRPMRVLIPASSSPHLRIYAFPPKLTSKQACLITAIIIIIIPTHSLKHQKLIPPSFPPLPSFTISPSHRSSVLKSSPCFTLGFEV